MQTSLGNWPPGIPISRSAVATPGHGAIDGVPYSSRARPSVPNVKTMVATRYGLRLLRYFMTSPSAMQCYQCQ